MGCVGGSVVNSGLQPKSLVIELVQELWFVGRLEDLRQSHLNRGQTNLSQP